MRRIVGSLLIYTLAGLAWAGQGATAEEHWYSVHLDGRKIGHMYSRRSVDALDVVVHEQALELSLERNGETLRIATLERHRETTAGEPLAFESRLDSAGSVARMQGELRGDGRVALRIEHDGNSQDQFIDWPDGALLAEGQALAARRAGLEPGTRYEVLGFDAGSLQPVRIHTVVGAIEAVDLHGQREHLIPLQQSLDFGVVDTSMRSWVDPGTRALRRMRMPVIGLQLEMQACSRECALAPVQPTDVLARTVVPAPRTLGKRMLGRALIYRVRVAQGDAQALALPPGQSLQSGQAPGEYLLRIDPHGDEADPPGPEDLAATRWLQSDDPALVALVHQATEGARDAADTVERLERFVRGYIRTKSLRVGYASAAEVVAQREGDCTEHAVLLAAMVRASGIPARVANGLAYAPDYLDHGDAFVPHAWVVAWVDGRWRGLDAALPGFDAGHIALSVGDGDPFRFYAGIDLLGAIEIAAIEPAPRQVRTR